jgi:glycosyltransferase A (GT-A) superfamily protein (DUF2064 family)
VTSASPALILFAKAPTAGLVKTRIATDIGDQQAANLAAAALLDTIDAVDEWAAPARRLAFVTGDLGSCARSREIADRLGSWQVAIQPNASLSGRLTAGFRAGARLWGKRPSVLIGMDTPQLSASDLDVLLEPCIGRARGGPTACIGPAEDGGWWGLALSRPSGACALEGVPMSTDRTCEWTAEALRRAGMRVAHAHRLRDMDTLQAAVAIAAGAPHLRTAAALGSWIAQGVS